MCERVLKSGHLGSCLLYTLGCDDVAWDSVTSPGNDDVTQDVTMSSGTVMMSPGTGFCWGHVKTPTVPPLGGVRWPPNLPSHHVLSPIPDPLVEEQHRGLQTVWTADVDKWTRLSVAHRGHGMRCSGVLSCPGVSESPLLGGSPGPEEPFPGLCEPRRLSCLDHILACGRTCPVSACAAFSHGAPAGASGQDAVLTHCSWSRGRSALTRLLTRPCAWGPFSHQYVSVSPLPAPA